MLTKSKNNDKVNENFQGIIHGNKHNVAYESLIGLPLMLAAMACLYKSLGWFFWRNFTSFLYIFRYRLFPSVTYTQASMPIPCKLKRSWLDLSFLIKPCAWEAFLRFSIDLGFTELVYGP